MSKCNLIVDFAYAFDFLSVLDIKKDFGAEQFKKFMDSYNNIKNQCPEVFETIIVSAEYKNLKDTNLVLFKAIDRCKISDSISAKEIDTLNHKRFQLKNELQMKYFGGVTTESKFGYKNDV